MKKIYFIVNPKAKNGSCLEIWKKVEAELKAQSISYFAFFTEYPGHAREISQSLIQKYRNSQISIVAVGGDGTLHEVVNGVAGNGHVTVGFIPGGSGNDFSRGFMIPNDPAEALKLILGSNYTEEIDIGKIKHKDFREIYFMNNMGVGFDAIVAKEANESKVKQMLNRFSMGRLVYAYILMKKLVTYQCIPLKIVVDGREYKYDAAWFVTVSNQPYYGGGMKIAPSALPDDGLLDVTVLHQLSRWKLLLVFVSVFWGKHTRFKEVEQFKGKSVFIHTPNGVPAHADGEAIGHAPLAIEACRSTLKIYTGNRREMQDRELKMNDCN